MIVGGKELNAGTLQNFFTFHTALFPLLLLTLVIYHFWRVRKAGGVFLPQKSEKDEMVPVMPNLVFREFIVALLLLAVLFTSAALFDAPLLEKANPAYSMNPTKAVHLGPGKAIIDSYSPVCRPGHPFGHTVQCLGCEF
jgi:quinol-cytochrome oxidoreductase complex cytochrome b subunit